MDRDELRATADNLERLRTALRATYPDDKNIDEIRDQDLLGDYPALRYYPPSGDLYLDIMTRVGETASYETVEKEFKIVDGIRVPVATPVALYRLKRDTIRPLDHRDAAVIAERFGLKEMD